MSLCIGCMREIADNVICPHCSFDNTKHQSSPLLPYGTVLEKRYIIGKEVEINSESTRYIAFDREKADRVYIREFLPAGYISREPMKAKVSVDASRAEMYEKLLDDFEKMFTFLSTISDMSAMNEILSIFRANNTCYVVEKCEEIISFEEYISHKSGHIEWEDARPLFMPVISLLETLHKNGYGHYAVSPSNIYITRSGKAVLFGFASAYARKKGSVLKPQLVSGCAAPEQYENNFPIDAITDIYGFMATLFFALTGSLPANANERLTNGVLLMSTTTVKRLPPHVVTALASGLQVKRENRITDFIELRSQLSVAPAVKAIQDEISRTASMANVSKPKKKRHGMSPLSVGIIVLVVALAVFMAIGFAILGAMYPDVPDNTDPSGASASVETNPPPVTEVGWTGPTIEDYQGQDYETVSKYLLQEYNISTYMQSYSDSRDGYSDEIDKGCIISQNLAVGTPIDTESGMIIVFKVSRGSLEVELPNVEDMSLSAAATKLANMGFTVYEDPTGKPSEKVAKGNVIGYRDYEAGDEVTPNTEIYLVLSLGNVSTEPGTAE
ncbi:MAG: PASTA domain-containing protein [Ruminococcus sp.]|nr:PASTA domain-containing protein [Ruminococcus sp.]